MIQIIIISIPFQKNNEKHMFYSKIKIEIHMWTYERNKKGKILQPIDWFANNPTISFMIHLIHYLFNVEEDLGLRQLLFSNHHTKKNTIWQVGSSHKCNH
jgi:hypothetical protein